MPNLLLLYHLPTPPTSAPLERGTRLRTLSLGTAVLQGQIRRRTAKIIFVFLRIWGGAIKNSPFSESLGDAEGGTWTHMREPSLRPERSASANSATSAFFSADWILSQRLVLSTWAIIYACFLKIKHLCECRIGDGRKICTLDRNRFLSG